MIKNKKSSNKKCQHARAAATSVPTFYYLRDTAPNWVEIAGEAVFSRGPTLRIPVRFGMVSVDGMVPGLLEVTAEGEVLERAFVNGSFEKRVVRIELCELDFRTTVKGLNKVTGALLLDAAPLFRAMARALAVLSRPPFLSPSPASEDRASLGTQ
jgi:hypothetical protein